MAGAAGSRVLAGSSRSPETGDGPGRMRGPPGSKRPGSQSVGSLGWTESGARAEAADADAFGATQPGTAGVKGLGSTSLPGLAGAGQARPRPHTTAGASAVVASPEQQQGGQARAARPHSQYDTLGMTALGVTKAMPWEDTQKLSALARQSHH